MLFCTGSECLITSRSIKRFTRDRALRDSFDWKMVSPASTFISRVVRSLTMDS